jgi:hypothetical protein
MNKRILSCGVVLVVLAMVATACQLPSGNPPPVTSPLPATSTSTSTVGVAAEPTNTSVPPTQEVPTVAASPTPLLPTSAPPTEPPVTAIPPTSTSLPQAIRIQFAAGGTSAVIDGDLQAGQTIYYVLNASATQTMSVKVSSNTGDVYLGVAGADGSVLLQSTDEDTTFSGTLPTTQDYYLSLTSGSATGYTLTVDIPPLPVVPTANVTPAPGTFDPVAAYGNPTFEDPMTGGNINDWVNPVSGLLPNTNYIKISESNAKFYVTGKVPYFSTWYFTWRELSDFYLQSTFDSGSCSERDAYGLIIRGPAHLAGVSYGYVVAFACDGEYWVFRLDSANPFTMKELVTWSKSDYIVAGANQENVMGIKAVGSTLTIYANGHQIAEIFDNKYASGRYGLFVMANVTPSYTYRVVQMEYWDLKP